VTACGVPFCSRREDNPFGEAPIFSPLKEQAILCGLAMPAPAGWPVPASDVTRPVALGAKEREADSGDAQISLLKTVVKRTCNDREDRLRFRTGRAPR
jgi:hypothetical protein